MQRKYFKPNRDRSRNTTTVPRNFALSMHIIEVGEEVQA